MTSKSDKTTKSSKTNKSTKTNKTKHKPYQPWIDKYPEGIDFFAEIDTTPVPERVDKAVKEHATRVAMDFLGAETTYAEMGDQIERMAGALQKELGLKKGNRVALLLPNTPFFPVIYYAALKIGATIVNCNPLYTHSELMHILKNSNPDILVTTDLKLTLEKAEKLMQEGVAKKLLVSHFPNALPGIKKVLFKIFKAKDLAKLSDEKVKANYLDWQALLDNNLQADPVKIDKDDMAVLQFTGGTTGTPKAAVLTHGNIAANLSQIDLWGVDLFRPGATLAAVIPFFHIFAMTVCMNTPLTSGVKVAMLPRYERKSLLEMIHRTKATILPAVPTLSHALATAPERNKYDLSSLKIGISGGAALPNETKQAFAKATGGRIAEGYGLTETSPVLCCAPLYAPNKDNSIGMPLPGTDIQFVDVEDPTKFVGPGERGELVAKGPQVMPGYLDNDDANKESFIDGYFRTGDVGYVDEDGHLYIVDRIKDIIICSGFNVYPRAIEDALYHHDEVDECNVIGVEDEYRGEAPIAFVKRVEGSNLGEEELREHLKKYLSKIEMPREIIFKSELPKTLVGKLSKNDLREEYAKLKKS
ncbi:long-chain-fatty-acid--CoA ligase [Maritalea mediterranea]|uniref:Long-chain fatty acid--CoA ligase n=1 Tax=Maritalea mediterranea TaxID=2909667 RepID=A0ABS9E9R7_9HYPH|nr:long-chain fatty acid--CoA ligase [Maritalea mediterranea]MCF4099608.1 long-chain fatty acid--CoA ligase [Maritalea mediterranea]